MTFNDIYESCREGVRRAVVGVDPATPGQDRTVTVYFCPACHHPSHPMICMLYRCGCDLMTGPGDMERHHPPGAAPSGGEG